MASINKKKSPVWKFFIETQDRKVVECKLCQMKISRGGVGKQATTSGMVNHLKNKHEDESRELKSNSKQESSSSSNKPSLCQKDLNLKQLNLLEYRDKFKQWDINDIRAKEYHYLIAEMLAVDNVSINMVERLGFTRLMKKALPLYKMPSRCFFMDRIIPDIYSKLVDKIRNMLIETDVISITTDMWTCLHNNVSFLSFTAHWLTYQFELKHAVLNMKHFEGQHTSQNISAALEEIPNMWDIDKSKIHVVIHDNGRNMVKAVKDTGIGSVNCFIHTLQLIVMDSLKIQPEVGEMIASGRRIITHFNHSGTAQEKLLRIQSELNLPQHKLLQDVSTRWNSTFYMLERLLEQKRSISLYLTDSNITNMPAAQWELLEQILRLLQPFEEVTKVTSSSFSCISETIPHVATLMRYFSKEETAQLAPKLQNTLLSIQQSLNNRFSYLKNDKNFMIATILDPRFKMNFFFDRFHGEKGRQCLLLEALKISCDTSSDESAPPSPRKKSKTTENIPDSHSSFWNCYNEIVTTRQTSSDDNDDIVTNEKNLISRELEAYLKMKCISRCDNPYTWWAVNKNLFSNFLTKFAIIYLSAPGSSVYSERLFSEAGNMYEEKRNRLLPSNAEKLVFLHHNLPLLNFNYE